MNNFSLGFIGFGEAAFYFIDGLQREREYAFNIFDLNKSTYDKITGLPTPSAINICSSFDETIEKSDFIFIAVPGKCDFPIFESISPSLTFNDKVIVDICTALPDEKKRISDIVHNKSGFYYDAAVMGSIPKLKQKVPIFVSGANDEKIRFLVSFGFNIRQVGCEPGMATKIKLCRSVYMKGIAALLIETEEIASACGVKNEVFQSLADSFDNDCFLDYSERLINGTYKHSFRRKEELGECLKIFNENNVDSIMTTAAYELYEKICKQ